MVVLRYMYQNNACYTCRQRNHSRAFSVLFKLLEKRIQRKGAQIHTAVRIKSAISSFMLDGNQFEYLISWFNKKQFSVIPTCVCTFRSKSMYISERQLYLKWYVNSRQNSKSNYLNYLKSNNM